MCPSLCDSLTPVVPVYSVLGWFAAVVSMNEKRTGPRYDQKEIFKVTTSDGGWVAQLVGRNMHAQSMCPSVHHVQYGL